ncbi:WD-repeats-region domain-containing protein [Favolaschia claudopus]|uniref:WD-repeats-region domain-containing protein n=1 Tax=Favolaschia claudopus TaxID=2862362 RepID=A0AAW0CU69_9AGAR
MRYRTLEIRWHDSKPISSCDFQPVQFKKARPQGDPRAFASQAYRLATGGEDNHVRVWMVYPNIRPAEVEAESMPDAGPPRPARVEYLATLSRHSAAVNVVRFSPNGEFIASAGDDGMVIIWAQSATPQTSTYGSDLSPEDLQHEKEYWKPRTTFRCTTMQVYDLAWSPTGEYLLTGSTDNCARVYASADGKCMLELAEHSHYVQGVAWDPLNEYIATQSSDRSMHVYKINTSKGVFEAHAVGRNTRFPVHHPHHRAHSRTPSVHRDDNLPPPLNLGHLSNMAMATPMNTPINPNASGSGNILTGGNEAWTRPPMFRSASMESERAARANEGEVPGTPFAGPGTPASLMPVTPVAGASTSGGGGGSAMFPPPPTAGTSSRRSSFSGSNAPSSPGGFSAVSGFSRYNRSPSPMPALPAIRTPPSSSAGWAGRYEERTRSRERGGSTSSRYDDRGSNNNPRFDGERGRFGCDERRHTDGGRLYGDESFTNFFRRLAFSPDGGLLLTPAGTFEDPTASVVGWEAGVDKDKDKDKDKGEGGSKEKASASAAATPATSSGTTPVDDASTPARGRKSRPVISTGTTLAGLPLGMGGSSSAAHGEGASNSSVYIYSRANFARPPVAQLPGHKKASVAVRFSPVLFELRPGVAGGASGSSQHGGEPRLGTGTATGEEGEGSERVRDVEESMEVDLVGPMVLPPPPTPATTSGNAAGTAQGIAAPIPQRSFDVMASPAMSPIDSNSRRPLTPAASKPGTPAPGHAHSASVTPSTAAAAASGSVFALPYRMLYAVVTMDAVAIYDTQQAGPVCLLTKLHYDEFTDLAWSPDGQCLMLSSRDGYCTLITFDEILPTHHTQQAALQLQQIAAQHSVPISYAPSSSSQTPSGSQSGSRKRPHEPLTPATSVDGDAASAGFPPSTSTPSLPALTSSTSIVSEANSDVTEAGGSATGDGPPKKKRRVALTRVGDL